MDEKVIEIGMPEGTMTAFAVQPAGFGPFPVVVLFQDIWGVREEFQRIARDVAEAGYYCLVPDFYYRFGNVHLAFYDDGGRMISLHNLSKDKEEQVLSLGARLSDEMVMADVEAIIGHLALSEPVDVHAMGGVGYCMGGRHVFHAASRFPESFRAVASLHGTALVTDAPDSPHRLIPKITGGLYCGYGELDRFSPPEVIAEIGRACAAAGIDYDHTVHIGVDHGYALPDRDIHDATATATDWAKIMMMVRKHLMTR